MHSAKLVESVYFSKNLTSSIMKQKSKIIRPPKTFSNSLCFGTFFCLSCLQRYSRNVTDLADLTRYSLDMYTFALKSHHTTSVLILKLSKCESTFEQNCTHANTFAKCKNAQSMSHNVITHISFTHFHFLCKWCHFHCILMANCSDIADSNRQAIRATGEKSQ